MKIALTKEPGTWIMFAIAFITGAAKAGRVDSVTIVVFVSLSLFLMAKAPIASFLRNKDKSIIPTIILYIVAGSSGSLYSILKQPALILLYGCAIILIIAFFLFGRKGSPLLSEASGMAIMGLVACIAASLGGEISANLYLWLMFFVFYFASSLRVRFTIKKYRILSGIYSGLILLLSAFMVYMGRWIFLSFIPLVEDSYSALTGKREDFKRLGIKETIKAIVFALLVIII